MKRYDIIRNFQYKQSFVLEYNVTLEQAQEYCKDPETSSSTCLERTSVMRTQLRGPWFDGYRLRKGNR